MTDQPERRYNGPPLRRVPTSPFEVEATKEAVNRRIEAGEITQGDLDLLKRGYKWMAWSSFIGSATCGLPTYYILRNFRRPPTPIGPRLLLSGGMGLLGSFLGFTIGGVGAAMEVNRQMDDPKRKMQVFQEIAMEARQRAMEKAAEASGNPIPAPRSGGSGIGGGGIGRPGMGSGVGSASTIDSKDAIWGEDDGSRRERAEELQREKDYNKEVKMLDRDGRFASDLDGNDIGQGPSTLSSPSSKDASSAGAGAWDRLRTKAFPKQARPGEQSSEPMVRGMRSGGMQDTGVSGGNRADAERTKEQREFDEMLERERQGAPEAEKVWR